MSLIFFFLFLVYFLFFLEDGLELCVCGVGVGWMVLEWVGDEVN